MAKPKTAPETFANAFIGKARPPTDRELSAALGQSKPLWDRLVAQLCSELHLSTREWNTHSTNAGWSLRIKEGNRTIVYLAPGPNAFRASFALGDKALQAAKACDFSKPVLRILESSKKYAEGTGVRIDVRGPKDIDVVKRLAEAKLRG
jgi:hypothetical protein